MASSSNGPYAPALRLLSLDQLLQNDISKCEVLFSSSSTTFSTPISLPLASLNLKSGDTIVGRPVSPAEATEHQRRWTILDISCMLDLKGKVVALQAPNQTQYGEILPRNRSNPRLFLCFEDSADMLPFSGQSMMQALESKYFSSQDIDSTADQPGPIGDSSDATSLSSSSSSIMSSTSSSLFEGIQVIGAMGGKSIEFHKAKFATIEAFGPSSSSFFANYPNISLHHMDITSFAPASYPQIPLLGLKSLDLSQNLLSSWRLHIAPILASSSRLNTLNLSANPILDLLDEYTAEEDLQTNAFVSTINSWLHSSSAPAKSVYIFSMILEETQTPQIGAASLPLELPANFLSDRQLFAPSASLTTLVLNKTDISWTSFVLIAASLSSLLEAHACLNNWTSLTPSKFLVDKRPLTCPSVTSLNFDANMLQSFENVASAMETFPNLNRLIISQNPISAIPVLSLPDSHPFYRRGGNQPWSLSLSSTKITQWSDLRALVAMIPELGELRFQRNHMKGFNGQVMSDQLCRHYVIATCPSVTMINGSSIADHERKDSERLFLVHYFSALPRSGLPPPTADPSSYIESLVATNDTIHRLWTTQRETTLDAYQRSAPSSTNSASGNQQSPGLNMLDVTIADREGHFVITKKLPPSTSIAKLRTIIAAALAQSPARDHFPDFSMSLLVPSALGPPSLSPLTSEHSTLMQETTLLKITVVIKPVM